MRKTGDEMEVVAFNPRAALVTVLFFAQYFVIVYMMTVLGNGKYQSCPQSRSPWRSSAA